MSKFYWDQYVRIKSDKSMALYQIKHVNKVKNKYTLNNDKEYKADELIPAVTDDIFNNLKQSAISIWQGYDDTYGYATGKIEHVKCITKREFYIILQMFDFNNQNKLFKMLNYNSKKLIIQYLNFNSGDYE